LDSLFVVVALFVVLAFKISEAIIENGGNDYQFRKSGFPVIFFWMWVGVIPATVKPTNPPPQ